MPALPFATPVTLDELWANILHDLGAPPYLNSHPIDLHGILLALDGKREMEAASAVQLAGMAGQS